MGYSRQGYARRRSTVTAGRVAKANARPGNCRGCGEEIPAHGGQLWRETSGAWSVVHTEAAQGGWLMHPQPVRGGCPVDTDKRNAELHSAGFFGPDAPAPASEREHIARMAASGAARREWETAKPVPVPRRGKCIDAPCCGCCD